MKYGFRLHCYNITCNKEETFKDFYNRVKRELDLDFNSGELSEKARHALLVIADLINDNDKDNKTKKELFRRLKQDIKSSWQLLPGEKVFLVSCFPDNSIKGKS